MASGKSSLLDVTNEIKIDHDNVRDLFQRYKNATNEDEKKLIANTLIREMAIHSDAEEISVYNDYKKLGLGDTAEHNKGTFHPSCYHCNQEHAEVKKLVYSADSTSFGSADYDGIMLNAVTAFLAHAKEEEDEQFDKLKAALSPEDNDKMARAFIKARGAAPPRPHPWAPQTGGILQKAAAAQANIHDKVVETFEGRKYVDLKYSHPE
ncbi:hypothetical protein PHLCEN_2v10856 [Hermanssonia centrifuga]|uniref:Hemerythrin-like domain-containing protein n=1 Tax=Hermanssonia centrifuga TaxID=98765 RepID=A0A2R6NLZ0_9APHY|nr:hypothetical protein PHLCEN_2v10856 [Hermanssonia centrifuga]